MKTRLRTIEIKVVWVVACLIWAWLFGFWCGTSSQRHHDVALIRFAAKELNSQPLEVVARYVEGNGRRDKEREEPNETP